MKIKFLPFLFSPLVFACKQKDNTDESLKTENQQLQSKLDSLQTSAPKKMYKTR